MNRQKKRRAGRFGQFGEFIAAAWLRVKGYRILAHGARAGGVEVDLIASKGNVVVFVEVKSRRDLATAADAIRPRQQRRIEQAAGAYLAHHPALATHDVRFDAVLVRPWAWPVHLTDAWRP